MVLLYKDEHEEFYTDDVEFANIMSSKIVDCINMKLDKSLDSIIDSTYSELKILREINIQKLID